MFKPEGSTHDSAMERRTGPLTALQASFSVRQPQRTSMQRHPRAIGSRALGDLAATVIVTVISPSVSQRRTEPRGGALATSADAGLGATAPPCGSNFLPKRTM